MKNTIALLAGLSLSAASLATGRIVITEWMYQGAEGEFIELTNVGSSAIDLTGWSYDDDSRLPGVFSLSGAGVVQAGQSILLVEPTAAASAPRGTSTRRSSFSISTRTTSAHGRDQHLRRGRQPRRSPDLRRSGLPGSPRTQNVSGWTSFDNLGANNVAGWVLSGFGDLQGSYFSANGDLGNPGVYVIPTPGAAALMGLGALVAGRRRR